MVIASAIVYFQILIEMICFFCLPNICFSKNCYIFSIMCNLFPSSLVYLEFLLGMGIALFKCISNVFCLGHMVWFFYFNLLKFLYCILLAYFLLLKHPSITRITSFGYTVFSKTFLDSVCKYFL